AEELRSITFFADAGSFADKAERLVRLVDRLGGGDASREAARLAKADQASELVREFPDLEGAIGAEYARLAGYPEAVCAAIEEQLEGVLDVPVEHVRAARASNAAELGEVAELARVLAALPDERLDRLHTVFTRANRIVAKAGDEALPEVRPELLQDEAEVAV